MVDTSDFMKKIKKEYKYEAEERCIKCGRRLKTPQSKVLGYGPLCYKKLMMERSKEKSRRLF